MGRVAIEEALRCLRRVGMVSMQPPASGVGSGAHSLGFCLGWGPPASALLDATVLLGCVHSGASRSPSCQPHVKPGGLS